MFEKSMRYAFAAAGLLFALMFLMIPFSSSADTSAIGDPIPAISCSNGMEATVFADGLAGPDALAFDGSGMIYVSEESSGQITKVESNGSKSVFVTGLNSPEGIAFAADGSPSFYINTEDNSEIHVGDPCFGRVIDGIEVVKRLESSPTRNGIWFEKRIGIKHVRIVS